ncbi:MAG TPA: hypothetical protein VJ599_00150 [Nitrososphaeraceae archaeon]|nr:hypothetical protein [Nitrososphaeraceae archaeon]
MSGIYEFNNWTSLIIQNDTVSFQAGVLRTILLQDIMGCILTTVMLSQWQIISTGDYME